jgi:hypothetical protein
VNGPFRVSTGKMLSLLEDENFFRATPNAVRVRLQSLDHVVGTVPYGIQPGIAAACFIHAVNCFSLSWSCS